MKYRIEHESDHRIRIRLYVSQITPEQEEILDYSFSSIKGVRKVVIYRRTASCALEYDGNREELLKKLSDFRYDNVTMMAKKVEPVISAEEMRLRHLDPAIKRKLRLRVLVETVADLALPVPIQLGYHAWQMITLRDI